MKLFTKYFLPLALLAATANAQQAVRYNPVTHQITEPTTLIIPQGFVTNLVSDLAAKAAASHTHPLGSLTQSGATPGQVAKWNGSAWVPADDATAAGGSDPTKANLSGGNDFLGIQRLDTLKYNPQNGGTITAGLTLTLDGSSICYATFSGATGTIALPTAAGTYNITLHGFSTYSTGTQTITLPPNLIRTEQDVDTAAVNFTIPASTGAEWTAQFMCINGVWRKVAITGDNLATTDAAALHTNVAGEINGLTAKATPTTSDIIVIEDAAAGNAKKKATLGSAPISTAQQAALDAKAPNAETRTGTNASPSTTNPLSPTWTGPMHVVYYGATGTINLPAAAGYDGRGILIYNTGAFTITIDANGSEVIVRTGTAQTGGVSIILSSGAGNYVALISDGTRWVTVGFLGTLAAGS